jgi:hypothetical protein
VQNLIAKQCDPLHHSHYLLSITAWLLVNGTATENVQFLQLCSQNLRTVIRKKAMTSLMQSQTSKLSDDSQAQQLHRNRFLMNQRLVECVQVFCESVDFSVCDEVPKDKTLLDTLDDTASKYKTFIAEDRLAQEQCSIIRKQAEVSLQQSAKMKSAAQTNAQNRDAADDGSGESNNDLNTEMVTEQQQEAQKQQEVLAEAIDSRHYDRTHEVENPYLLRNLFAFADKKFSSVAYKLSDFLLYQVPAKTSSISFPDNVFVTENHTNKSFNKNLRKLKSVHVILEMTSSGSGSNSNIDSISVNSTHGVLDEASLKQTFELFCSHNKDGNSSSHSNQVREIPASSFAEMLTALGHVWPSVLSSNSSSISSNKSDSPGANDAGSANEAEQRQIALMKAAEVKNVFTACGLNANQALNEVSYAKLRAHLENAKSKQSGQRKRIYMAISLLEMNSLRYVTHRF